MAQATTTTVDLPDPMEGRPAQGAGGAAGADDLLDRLAGDEIDRLLAGIEMEPPAAVSRTRERVDFGPGPSERHTTQPDATAVALQLETEHVTPSPEAAAPAPASMERLLARFDAPPVPEGLPEPPHFDDVVATDDAGTSLAERGALDEAGGDEFTVAEDGDGRMGGEESAEIEDALGEVEEIPGEPLPAYLRPLEWLNAPLDALPGSAREAVGKVAILALVNALAVLLYVLIFRR